MIFDREIKLLGAENFEKLQRSNIILFGLGGVGGFVAEFLVRSGIKNLTIVDFDTIDETNINRQIIALSNNLGSYKTIEFEKRLKLINPNINLIIKTCKLKEENIEDFELEKFTYVIDAIDDFSAKTAIIKYCYEKKKNFICSLAVGRKYDIPNYRVDSILNTTYDPIAKKLRKFAKENCIKNFKVVYSNSEAIKNAQDIGSISYHPPACASVLCGFVINEILKENKDE